jgi:integrase
VSRHTHSRRDERGRPITSWRFVVELPRRSNGKRRQKIVSGFETQETAQRAMRAFQSTLDNGDFIEPDALTVQEQVDLWLRGRRNVEPTTVRGYTVALSHATAAFGDRNLQTISRADVEALVDGMTGREKPLSARTVQFTLGLLKRVFREAVRDGIIRRNPAEFVDPPRGRQQEMQTWQPDEMRAFERKASEHRLAPAWRLTLAGLRRSEVMGLRWSDLDLEAGTVTIAQARVMLNDRTTYIKEPKTARGRRTLALDAAATRAFNDYRLRLLEESLAFGEDYDTSHDLVVVDQAGRPLRPEYYGDEFKRLSKAAGVPVIRLHDARHTCASYLHAQGLPTAAISAWLGHASASFTLNRYVHAQADGMELARDLLATAFTSRGEELPAG